MAITVKHNKVSTIPDTTDTSLVRPSDWNADHTLVGTIDVANGGTGASTLTGYVKGNGTSAMTAVATVPSTDITGLGTMSTQNANAVAITGGTITGVSGLVTSVTGTSPVVSSGGTTPAISMPAATASVNGYLTSTDWTTFNNKGSGTVTSVSATSPVTSTGGATPNIAMPAATTSVNGYLTSTDWTTFNSKGNGTVTSVATGTGLTGGTITSTGTIAIDSTVTTNSGTQTLTNKRINPRVLASTADSATPTLNTDDYDMMVITGQSVAITNFSTNLTGTPVNGQKLIIAITGTTAIAITWGTSFESSTVTLPSTTVTTNRLDIGFIYNVATSDWRCVAVA